MRLKRGAIQSNCHSAAPSSPSPATGRRRERHANESSRTPPPRRRPCSSRWSNRSCIFTKSSLVDPTAFV